MNLVHERAETIFPENVAAHFARIRALYTAHGIVDACQAFNVDESGFSISRISYGSLSKRVYKQTSRANIRQLKWKGTCDHVKLVAIVKAAGQNYNTLFVLPGVRARYRRPPDGRDEMRYDYLHKPNYHICGKFLG